MNVGSFSSGGFFSRIEFYMCLLCIAIVEAFLLSLITREVLSPIDLCL
jgi:hypothetical protein